MRQVILVVALLLSGGGAIAPVAVADENADNLAKLPEGPGKAETYFFCSACHSFRLVAQQGLSRERWTETLKWMVEEQGMPELEEPELSLILDYLSDNFGIDRRPAN